jgi:integrase
MRYTFHDFRRIFVTDAIMHGLPPHIAALVVGHRDVNTTMGYKNSRELHQTGEGTADLRQLAA